MLIDSHAHLDFEDYGPDRDGVIARFQEAGVSKVVLVGLWKAHADFGNAQELTSAHPGLFVPTAGVHPHDCARVGEDDWKKLEELCSLAQTVAVGETGLDYHYDHSPREDQRRWFRHQIRLARRLNKPVVVHTREADDDTAAILREEPTGPGVIHCFTGGPDRARTYLDMGFHLSVAGVVTFKTATDLREAVKMAPLDRLLVETDSPFLAPVPHRGKRNEPANVRLVAEALAELKGLPFEEVARRTTENAMALFGLA